MRRLGVYSTLLNQKPKSCPDTCLVDRSACGSESTIAGLNTEITSGHGGLFDESINKDSLAGKARVLIIRGFLQRMGIRESAISRLQLALGITRNNLDGIYKVR
jgi:hypothetical protein